MTIESIVGSLIQSEKLQAMELIWTDLLRNGPDYATPAWHEKVVAERLANPAPGKALGLDEAKTERLENLHALRTQS